MILVCFCNWARRRCDNTQPFLLPFLSQERLSTNLWSPWKFETLIGQQAFSTRPTSEVGNDRLRSVGLWGECHESCRSGATVGENNEGSWENNWSWETGSTLFLRTSLSTRPVQWTRILGVWLKFLPSLKCCVSAEIMNWCTKYQVWAQFILPAVRMNGDVTWSSDEVLVSVYICAVLCT